MKKLTMIFGALILALTSLAPIAVKADPIRNYYRDPITSYGVSTTTLVQVTKTSCVAGTSVFWVTVTARAVVVIDNSANTGTIYATFTPLSYSALSMNTAGGLNMEVVLAAQKGTWKAQDGTLPNFTCLPCGQAGGAWLNIINASGLPSPLINKF